MARLMLRSVQRTLHSSAASIENVGINHCRPHVLMAQQFLHRPDVVTIFKKMRGKAVAQSMTTRAECYIAKGRVARRGFMI